MIEPRAGGFAIVVVNARVLRRMSIAGAAVAAAAFFVESAQAISPHALRPDGVRTASARRPIGGGAEIRSAGAAHPVEPAEGDAGIGNRAMRAAAKPSLASEECGSGTDLPSCVPPNPLSDSYFVVNKDGDLDVSNPDLDADCRFADQGRLKISIPIDRYVGDIAKGVRSGSIEPYARIDLMMFDVDVNGLPGTPGPPEIDNVYVNDRFVGTLTVGQSLTWNGNFIRVPIEILKFPQARGSGGLPPTPAINEIEIEIDSARADRTWCTAIDWAAIKIDAIYPIALVHGIAADHTTWAAQPDQGGGISTKQFLLEAGVPLSDEIDLERHGSVAENGNLLFGWLQFIARSFGVHKINVVAHSKGGLDSIQYFLKVHDPEVEGFHVGGFYTLDSPHEGTVLASMSYAHRTSRYWLALTDVDERLGKYLFFDFLAAILNIGGQRPGLRDLTVQRSAARNARSSFRPRDRKRANPADAPDSEVRSPARFVTMAANADSEPPYDKITCGEYWAMGSACSPTRESALGLAHWYLSRATDVLVNQEMCDAAGGGSACRYRLPNTDHLLSSPFNSLLVHTTSAKFDKVKDVFLGTHSANHSQIKDGTTARWILDDLLGSRP